MYVDQSGPVSFCHY